MTDWLWGQYRDFATGIALIFWALIFIGLARGAWAEPRRFGAKVCGSLAWFFFLLAALWGAHISDKWMY
jgi:hypothetical protein